MSLWVGLGGATRNACVAVSGREAILGVCEQERITRLRAAGVNPTGLPDEALDELLGRAGRRRGDVTGYVAADNAPAPTGVESVRLGHHFLHAYATFRTSSFDAATIVICDHEPPQVSVWEGRDNAVTRVDWPWDGPGFADLYSQCATGLGFRPGGHEQRMEALARLDPAGRDSRVEQLFGLAADRFELTTGWQSRVSSWTDGRPPREETATLAAALQSRLADLLVEFLSRVRRRTPGTPRLCVGGGLFYNSHINTSVKKSGVFDDVFVPVNPGNAGLAIGAALYASGHAPHAVSPFLGPSYSSEEIKATIDNCKLKYEWASDSDAVTIAVEALQKGRLVAWFEGAMEWGSRALGARSIVASPFAPYVLDNLNRFLKHRESWRGYALSGLDAAIAEHFDGPPGSPFMDCDYVPRDRDRFRPVLPGSHASVRVQTVGPAAPPRFRALVRAFGDATGIPIVVNTSFNGFREPIVCSPRDAVRVFYGTGIDILVLGQFVISK